ncbi:MAG: hypothetical protein JJU29_23935 [Verrucomicrobia bacterium]|nr:hypothetical protein [Verrucomicrobiota bacterium]
MDSKLIDEVRKAREEIAKEVDFDFHRLFKQIYREQVTQPTVNLKEGHERATCCPPKQVAESSPSYGQKS